MVKILASLQSLWKPNKERVMIFGNDSVGKTTLLYQLKNGQCYATIPTIGFNIESVAYQKSTYEFWDIGGRNKIRWSKLQPLTGSSKGCAGIKPLWRHYAAQENHYWFLVDVSDVERMDEALDDLHHTAELMVDVGSRFLFIVFNKQDTLSILSIEDQSKHMENLRSRFASAMTPYNGRLCYTLCDTLRLSAATGENIWNLVEIMHQILAEYRGKHTKPRETMTTAPNLERPSDEALEAQIKEDFCKDLDTEIFWKQFEEADLPTWDHRSHLRAGYLILLDSYAVGKSAFDAAETFIAHLARLRAARPDHFRNTTHRTMTMFWIVQLEYAIRSYHFEIGKQLEWPKPNDFQALLLSAPTLMYGGLWKDYYSKDRLFSQEARDNWILPDLRSLPQFVRIESKLVSSTDNNGKDYSSNLLRVGFRVVQEYMSGNARRGWLVKEALSSLQRKTMRERARDASIPPYSETQAYFWIQMAHAALATVYLNKSTDKLPPLKNLSFESFKTLSGLKPTEWQIYYTASLWNSVEARMNFVLPDKQLLPNVLKVPSQAAVAQAIDQQLSATLETNTLSCAEDVMSRLIVILKESELLEQASIDEIETHTQLLLVLYRLLFKNTPELAVKQATKALSEIGGTRLPGYTARCFWIQQALHARLEHKSDAVVTFTEFLQASPEIIDENLHEKYYSTALWMSLEAKESFVQPDKMKMTAFSKAVA